VCDPLAIPEILRVPRDSENHDKGPFMRAGDELDSVNLSSFSSYPRLTFALEDSRTVNSSPQLSLCNRAKANIERDEMREKRK